MVYITGYATNASDESLLRVFQRNFLFEVIIEGPNELSRTEDECTIVGISLANFTSNKL